MKAGDQHGNLVATVFALHALGFHMDARSKPSTFPLPIQRPACALGKQ